MRMTRLFGYCGYLLYTIAVLLFMLWLQFPAATVKAKAEAELNQLYPGLHWKIGAVGLTFPANIRLRQITGKSKGEKESLLMIDSLSLRPDLPRWLKTGTWSVHYQVNLLGGSVSGGLAPAKVGINCAGELKDIHLDKLDLRTLYGRTVSGALSGTFTGKHDGRLLTEAEAHLSVSKGMVSLQQPVLGMKQLVFDTLRSTLKRQAGTVLIEDGKLESKLLHAEFSGDLRLLESVASSLIHLNGSLIPRPEFFASLSGANMLKSQLKEGKLPFTLTGTVHEPGIIFAGLPTNFQQQVQGRSRQP